VLRPTLAVLALAALTSCGTDTTPSEPTGCVQLDGAYSYTYAEGSCERNGTSLDRVVVINQSGCSVNAVIPGYALLDGTVTGDTIVFALTLLASSGPCGNAHLSGTARVTSSGGHMTISGTYGSAAAPPSGCACVAGSGQGTLTLSM
jgi:hypothetical protein